MSDTYSIVCIDCKTGVELGKTVYIQYKDIEKKSLGFNLLGYSDNEKSWKPNKKECSTLQHFLILHRTHELRVLPDTVDKYASFVGVPQSFPTDNDDPDPLYNRKIFLSQDVGKPEPEQEANNLPNSVIEKLKKF